MADIRKILGPFGRHIDACEISWGFIGVMADYETAHWSLVFSYEHRNFHVFRSQPLEVRAPSASGSVVWSKAGAIINPYMFLTGRETIIRGRIVDALRARLSEDDIANCARLAMDRGRQWLR